MRVRVALFGLVLLTAISGCGEPSAPQDNIIEIAPSEREAPVSVSGTTLQGRAIDLADYRGEVVVLNFWGSWCGPCRAEAPTLRAASEQIDAVFVGAQLREESRANAVAFEEEFGISYPTIEDGGASALEMGSYGPRLPPSTVVLDRDGRVASLISGVVPSVQSLRSIVEAVGE